MEGWLYFKQAIKKINKNKAEKPQQNKKPKPKLHIKKAENYLRLQFFFIVKCDTLKK